MSEERICKTCKRQLKGACLTCSKGTICGECAKDISMAEMQPMMFRNTILWVLCEVFTRRAKGESVSFEKVWKEDPNMKLISFDDVYNYE